MNTTTQATRTNPANWESLSASQRRLAIRQIAARIIENERAAAASN